MAAGKSKVAHNDNGEKVGTPLQSSEKKKKKTPSSSKEKKVLVTPSRRSTQGDEDEGTTVKTKSSKKKEKKVSKQPESAVKDNDDSTKDVSMDSPDVKSPKRRKRKKSIDVKVDASPSTSEPKQTEEEDEDGDVKVIYDDKPKEEEEDKTVTCEAVPPMLSVKMHRMRHLKFQPQAVLTMAGTPHDPKASDYVAVSRESGCVELKSPDEKFRTLAKIAGLKSKSVDVMAWVVCEGGSGKDAPENKTSYATDFHKSLTEIHAQRTLIGGSKDGTIFVIDFSKGGYEAVTGSGGGGVFALTSLSGSNLVAAGCEDGSVRIYKLDRSSKAHRLTLVSTVPSAGASILSLAWCREKGSSDVVGMGGTVLYAGIADGTIRRYECKSAASHARSKGTIVKDDSSSFDYGKQTWSSKMRMTVESYGRTTPTRVWALQALSDGTLISGDSLGHVQFWDAKTGTLLQSFEQNDNKADTLALAVSPDESHVFASGIDSRIICIQRSLESVSGDSPTRWVMTYAQRPHTHDVKALVVCHVHSKSGSLTYSNELKEMICSGGVDTKICSCNIKSFKLSRPKLWFPWPTQTPISIARQARVLLMRREDSLELHQLGPKEIDSLPLVLQDEDNFIGSMDIQSSHNLMCSDISEDGRYVVASTGSLLLLFRIEYIENDDGTPGFAPKQIPLNNECKSPCLAVKFLTNNSIVCASNEGPLHLLKIAAKESDSNDEDNMENDETKGVDVSLINSFDDSNQPGNSMFGVHSIVVSDDGQQFATVRSGVGSGTVRVFNVKDDMIQKYWTVSALEAPISVASFLLGSRKRLAVACSNFAVYVFDLKERKLSEWSEKNGFPLTPTLPQELNRSFDYPLRIIPNPKTPEKFVVGAFGSFCAINMAKGIPKRSRMVPEMKLRGRKRKRHVAETTVDPNYGNFTLCLRYNSMIHMDYVGEDELLVVEQPWLSVVANFPAALERKVYGT